jgi:hypothetical protein
MLSKIWLSGTCLSLGLLLPACSQTWVRREPETGFHAYLDGSSVNASTQLDWYRGGYEYRLSYGNSEGATVTWPGLSRWSSGGITWEA